MHTIRKLNKRLIYVCLMATSVIVIPLIILPVIVNENNGNVSHQAERMAIQAHGNANDAFTISGTEKFPESYAQLKVFEKEIEEKTLPSEEHQLLEALEQMEHAKNSVALATMPERGIYRANYDQDNPWQEAKKREQKQQAFDHYEAKRSDILFIDHNKTNPKGNNGDLLQHPSAIDQGKNDVFFVSRAKKQIGRSKEAPPFMVAQGTLIPAILRSEIDTSLPGPILARISQNIWDSKTGQSLLIPQNSTLIGVYASSIAHGQTRAQIAWQRIIFPNQQSIDLGTMVGVDKKGISGTSGVVDNHFDKVALSLLLTTALGTSVRLSQGKYEPSSATLSQEMGNSLSQETARLGNKIADKMLSIPPTIKVPMGQRLNVFVEQDLSIEPYTG
jgi:type IV secretion system protein VirB10